jgi:hypothetical protein
VDDEVLERKRYNTVRHIIDTIAICLFLLSLLVDDRKGLVELPMFIPRTVAEVKTKDVVL